MGEEEVEVWPRAKTTRNKCFKLGDSTANSNNLKVSCIGRPKRKRRSLDLWRRDRKWLSWSTMKLAFYPRERDLKDFKQRELKRVWINPFNDNVENMRLAVAKLELRRSTGGYCDSLVKEDKNVNMALERWEHIWRTFGRWFSKIQLMWGMNRCKEWLSSFWWDLG